METPVSSVGLRPPPVHDQEGAPYRHRAGELDEAVYNDRGERVGDADLLDDRRAVVDDGVDAGYLDQEPEPDDKRSGQPEVPLEELAEAALLLVGEVLFDPRYFFFGIHVLFGSPNEVQRLLAPAVHQGPSGRVRQAKDKKQHDEGGDRREREDQTPALGAGQGRPDEVGEGNAQDGGYLEGDDHGAPDAPRRGLRDVGRRRDDRDADGEPEEEPGDDQEPLVGREALEGREDSVT